MKASFLNHPHLNILSTDFIKATFQLFNQLLIIIVQLFHFVFLIKQLWIGLKSVYFILKKNPIARNIL